MICSNATQLTDYTALASNTVCTGIAAAYGACGYRLEGAGIRDSNSISTYGLNMVSIGLTLEKVKVKGSDAPEVEYADSQKPESTQKDSFQITLKIVHDKTPRVILGAQIMARKDVSMGIHLFSPVIQEQITIDRPALTDLFPLPHPSKPYSYITMTALNTR